MSPVRQSEQLGPEQDTRFDRVRCGEGRRRDLPSTFWSDRQDLQSSTLSGDMNTLVADSVDLAWRADDFTEASYQVFADVVDSHFPSTQGRPGTR